MKMIYPCGRCGRTFECEEAIFYCPFCGTSYGNDAFAATRIIIGSDSERTVQEKYWQRTGLEIIKAVRLLQREIPNPEKTEKRSIDLREWSCRQEKCDSLVQFKLRFEALLDQMDHLLQQNPLENSPEPIPIEKLAARFDALGARISEALGEAAALQHPALRYEPIALKKQTPEAISGSETLFATIQSVWPRIFAIMRECGTFVMSSALKRLSYGEESKIEPSKLSRRIQRLAQKEYDPLFCEDCDELTDAFCMGILLLARIANERNALCEYDENECAKIDALNAYADDWAHALRSALDRAYQAQQLDMLGAYESVRRICAETEEEYKARNREEEE